MQYEKYEYLVLEGDAPVVPPEILNERGDEGWILTTVVPREENNKKTWILYFYRTNAVQNAEMPGFAARGLPWQSGGSHEEIKVEELKVEDVKIEEVKIEEVKIEE